MKAVALRLIGSAVPGAPLSVCELVPSGLEFVSGEIWSGDGSLHFTGESTFSAVHELPIVADLDARRSRSFWLSNDNKRASAQNRNSVQMPLDFMVLPNINSGCAREWIVSTRTAKQSTESLHMTSHKVLIVDDHSITQNGLRFLFSGLDRYEIVTALDCGATVSAFVQSQPIDIVILDLNLPDVRGINVLAEIVGSRDMTVIILSGENNLSEIHSALKLGARAVVSKSDPLEHIVAACDAALAGDIYVSPYMTEALGKFQQPPVALSSRQMAILHYLAQGETNKEIAYRLAIAPPTVSFHIAELRRKLDVSHNRKIVERANELNLL